MKSSLTLISIYVFSFSIIASSDCFSQNSSGKKAWKERKMEKREQKEKSRPTRNAPRMPVPMSGPSGLDWRRPYTLMHRQPELEATSLQGLPPSPRFREGQRTSDRTPPEFPYYHPDTNPYNIPPSKTGRPFHWQHGYVPRFDEPLEDRKAWAKSRIERAIVDYYRAKGGFQILKQANEAGRTLGPLIEGTQDPTFLNTVHFYTWVGYSDVEPEAREKFCEDLLATMKFRKDVGGFIITDYYSEISRDAGSLLKSIWGGANAGE